MRKLKLLPKAFPESDWRKYACEALRFNKANPQLHALLADYFMAKKAYASAHFHQELAGRYAATAKEKARWRKQAAKTARQL